MAAGLSAVCRKGAENGKIIIEGMSERTKGSGSDLSEEERHQCQRGGRAGLCSASLRLSERISRYCEASA